MKQSSDSCLVITPNTAWKRKEWQVKNTSRKRTLHLKWLRPFLFKTNFLMCKIYTNFLILACHFISTQNNLLMKRFRTLLFVLVIAFPVIRVNSQSAVKKVIFQAFWWDYWNSNYPASWSNYLTELAPRLKQMGFNAIWIPPCSKNGGVNSVGYSPFDHYDLGDKYQKVDNYWKANGRSTTTRLGTKDELLRMIAVYHANGIEVIQDLVLNHLDNAGSLNGSGGVDSAANSLATNNGYKNFRYSSYATPSLNESREDYFTRSGRWYKNFSNFYPNQFNPCCTNDINNPLFGPDISFENNGFGQSSNIPATGSATINGITRPYYNPPINTGTELLNVQSPNYMRNNARSWMIWLKKQTGTDGWRWDAIKHFPIYTQEDFIYNTKYLAGFANGGEDMFCAAEWVGGTSSLDAYVNAVKSGNEKHTGTFDFNYRAFGSNGGVYSMIMSLGGFNMQNLPGEQQGERFYNYGTKRVHRTVPFINNHDTYRPILNANGNISGWNGGSELSPHIDPTEPRLAAAYAAITAIDGNPQYFFEDVFNIQNTGKRFSHLPTSTTDLPERSDLVNILLAHQKLGFKDGDYGVPTSVSGNPFYAKGSAGDHLVLERKGKALIGITDKFNTGADTTNDEAVYVRCSFPIGTVLYDFTGAHGINAVTVTNYFGDVNIPWVLIRTAPVSHTIPGAYGHGYSIWAPVPPGVTISSVQDLYNYLATYAPTRNPRTQQEWEMDDDLGDSHCSSLMQGGRIPDNKTNQRIAGKIFAAAGKVVIISVTKANASLPLMVSLWDLNGNKLAENISGAGETIFYTPAADGWLVIKIRNANVQAGQTCKVLADYQAPQVIAINDIANQVNSKVAIWTGNKGTTDITDCGNWEEGKMPDTNTNLLVPAWSMPYPVINFNTGAKNILVEKSATLTVLSGVVLTATGNVKNGALIGPANF